jgi:tryptophanase
MSGENIPLEMHKVRMVQKINLLPVEERLKAINEAGFNTFLLRNRDVFLDQLTDSGVNAMSQEQYAAMMQADDSYAGSETFYRLEAVLQNIFGMKYFLPAHQGRACEHLISKVLVKPGMTTIMNYHFTTTKAHITLLGGAVEEIVIDEGLKINSSHPFKGDLNIDKLNDLIKKLGREKIAFVRIEAGTNLIGGQPVSMDNMRKVSDICRNANVPLVYDASLLGDNLYFIKERDEKYKDVDIRSICREIASMMDVIYFSARKLGSARGGGILVNDDSLYLKLRDLVPLYEGFLTYGGMSVREMEALAVGLQETMDFEVVNQTPIIVEALCNELLSKGVPVVTPPGGLGCHVDATAVCEHLPQTQYRAGALTAAIYIASGVRNMERGTMSEQRNEDGSERFAEMELARLAVPRRVFTLSQVKYTADRLNWLYQNRELIGGLEFVEEPRVLRFFFGRLKPIGNWPDVLAARFRRDFGDSL